MVKTWVDIETKLGLEVVAQLGAHLLGIQVEKLGAPRERLQAERGVVRVHFYKPYAIPISQVRDTLAIACKAVEIAGWSKP